MTSAEYETLREQVVGGPENLVAYDLAVSAAYLFAQRSGCPAGRNVMHWLVTKSDEMQAAWKASFADPGGTPGAAVAP